MMREVEQAHKIGQMKGKKTAGLGQNGTDKELLALDRQIVSEFEKLAEKQQKELERIKIPGIYVSRDKNVLEFQKQVISIILMCNIT
jgi:hypothetical protein